MATTELTTKNDNELVKILISSVFPGATQDSAMLALQYCRAAGLDVMQKPVHIVPMWDSKAGSMRDVIMPGIGLYRIAAARTGEYLGMSEPEFGPDVTQKIGGAELTFPAWCKVICYRAVGGHKAEFPAIERWLENYAVRGGKEKSIAPNAMWMRRPYAQLLKCTEAQALRKAFPEVGAQPTAEEMEGRVIEEREVYGTHSTVKAEPAPLPEYPAEKMEEMLPKWQAAIETGRSDADGIIAMVSTKFTLTEEQQQAIHALDQGEAA